MDNKIKYQITKAGLEVKKARLAELRIEKEKNKTALEEARALGDLSENSDWDNARAAQRAIASEIEELEDLFKNFEIIPEEWVEVEFVDTKKVRKFQVVGTLEADPLSDKISFSSPLAIALQGKKKGDVFTFQSGSGKTVRIKVIEANL